MDDLYVDAPGMSAIPFTAAVDDAGRLTSLVLDMAETRGRTPAGTWTITISGYGKQVSQG